MRAVGEADARGPIGEAIESALESLATFVFESGNLDAGGAQAIQAIEFQRQALNAEAVGAYRRALAANMRHSSVYLNLGALQLELEHWDDAIHKPQICVYCGYCADYCPYGVIQAEEIGET